jgi:hypothetical protein
MLTPVRGFEFHARISFMIWSRLSLGFARITAKNHLENVHYGKAVVRPSWSPVLNRLSRHVPAHTSRTLH